MKSTEDKIKFEANIAKEKENISKIVLSVGFHLDEEQPHISGERFLMTRNKLVLSGTRISDGKKVIIKISKHPDGKKEIIKEKNVRDLLSSLPFTYNLILFPEEVHFSEHEDYIIWISSYIMQDKVFVSHTLEEQFFIALKSFETKESFHATTFEHIKTIKNTFSIFYAKEYLNELNKFLESFHKNYHNKIIEKTLKKAQEFLNVNKTTIDKYSGYLTHTDFVPHNFRINKKGLYMLDCSSIYFGNKYEGWARFLNYMIIHNTKLEKILTEYIRKNRGEDEYLSLRIMRIYKIVQLLEYYAKSSEKTEGNLFTLTITRINFWHQVLLIILEDKSVDDKIIERYVLERNKLRSEEEKKRQREFAVA